MSTGPDDPRPEGEPIDEEAERGLQDILRRAIRSGVRTVREGEEKIRDIATAIATNEKVEAVTTTISQVREDLVGVAGRELRRYLDRLNLTDEIVKVLTAISLEVKTEIRFIPNDKKLVKPNIKSEFSVNRTRKKDAKKPPRTSRRRRKKGDVDPEADESDPET